MSRRDGIDALLETLVRLRRRAGVDAYERALLAARVAVAKVVLAEAERAAGRPRAPPPGRVVPFRRPIPTRDP